MFRELSRINKKISNEECIELLKNEKRGVLSVNGDDGYPYAMPMNHFYNEADGCIYFHSGKNGHRTDSIKKSSKASLCIYNEGYKNENEWAYNIKSVIVFGNIEIITDTDTIISITRALSYKFTDDKEYIENEIKAYSDKTILLKLTPQNICGKLVLEA